MFRALLIVATTIVVLVAILILTAALGAFLKARDRARVERARRASLTARERLDLERKLSESRDRIEVRVVILPIGENSYRWIAWDDAPLFPEQVEGVLVPYCAGMAPSFEEAEADARVNVFRRLEGRGSVVVVELEPETPQRADRDSPS